MREGGYIVTIKDIIDDAKYQDNVHIVGEDEVDYFKKEFKKIEKYANQTRNDPSKPKTDKFDLFHMDMNFYENHEDDITRMLTLILSHIIDKSDVYYTIGQIYEDLEFTANSDVDIKDITYRIKIALEYNTENIIMCVIKKVKKRESNYTEILLSRNYNDYDIGDLLDLVVNIRGGESIGKILEDPNKKIDLIDGLDSLEQREDL